MRSSSGTLMCLGSGAAFGAMAVFGKLAYAGGATVGTLLSVRFALAAALFWVLLGAGGARELRALDRRDLVAGLALGACAYALQAGLYFAALERIDASLLSLVLYTFPAIVAAAAIALGRERADGRRLAALALASAGLALVVAGAGAGALDPLGAALGLGAAFVYSAYILVGEGIAARVRPTLLAALVCTGAAVSLGAGSMLLGELRPGALTAAGWGWLVCLAAVSTVAAIGLFFAGLPRVGPTTASILATVEPLVTVILAFLVFGERLGPVQLAGGALVLVAVVALHVRRPGRLRRLPGNARRIPTAPPDADAMTISSLTFPSLGDFYFADARRLSSREHELGLWWRTSHFNGPVIRAAYVETTGEIYVMQLEGLPGGGRVEVVTTRETLDAVLADLDGFERVCGEPGSLWWLLDRLAPERRAAEGVKMPVHA